MKLVNRFLSYVSFETTSCAASKTTPSTAGQLVFANFLANELRKIRLHDVTVDDNGYLTATLPANTNKKIPTIGFIAHLDTSPDVSGSNPQARIVKNYDGKDIFLNDDVILHTSEFPEIVQYKGQDIIVTDGTTLLGADDKAGIAEIVTAMEYFVEHPEIEHGTVRVAFTPDEEIGQGAAHFDVDKFAAEWAYTIDGGEIGELEYENFNAAIAEIKFVGRNVHPGYAKNKMRNALRMASDFIARLPVEKSPENTDDYEGFYHPTEIKGNVEEAFLSLIIRDHNKEKFEAKKQYIISVLNDIDKKYGKKCHDLILRDQYYNMREIVEKSPHVIALAEEAMKKAGITPKIKPIRGGTDGAQLSFKALPCPNIFAGGHNFHSRYEYIPVQSMEKAVEVIVGIVREVSK